MIGCIVKCYRSRPERSQQRACLSRMHAARAGHEPGADHECRWLFRADCRRGSVAEGGVALGAGLQISYLNSRPQRVQFQTAKSSCFTVGAVSKS
jgi:hypothetical protein